MAELTTDITQQQAVTALRILYPIWAIVGIFSIQYVPSTLIVSGDAAKTASNIVANESLFRMGIAGSLVTQLMHIIAVLVLYQLFKSVDKKQAFLVVLFGLVGVPIAMLNELNNLAALAQVGNPGKMMFFLDMNSQGIQIASIFWGLWLFPLGYLVYNSGYFPKIFGYSLYLAGIGYFVGSFMYIISGAIPPVVEILTMGEVLFMLWLVLKGAHLPES